MKKNLYFVGIFISALLILSACSGGNDNTNSNNNNHSSSNYSDDNDNYSNDNGLVGTVISIDDTGLPGIYSLAIEADNGDVYYMNYETWDGDPYEVLNQTVQVTYNSYDQLNVVDIMYQGYSMYGEWGGVYLNGGSIDPGWSVIEGTFEASEVSGDLPETITIYGLDGNEISFEEFVDDEMYGYNGLLVTVYYVQSEMTEVETLSIL